MKPDLRDPRLLRAWALSFVERAQSEGMSGMVRTHFEGGTITRCETTRREMPAHGPGGGSNPEESGVLLAWADGILEREQRNLLYGRVDFPLEAGQVTRAKTEKSEKPPQR